ncbi:MAG: glycosyltransferase [Planctomycetota bacterium]
MASRSTTNEQRSTPLRVALYSHDSYGLGHLRRTLVLAQALGNLETAVETLIVTGSPRALFFEAPPSVRIVPLPAVTKNAEGNYVSRNSSIPLQQTLRMRKGIIRHSVLSFRPHMLVVDHAPSGLRGELLPLLGDLRWRGETELVLGLRDILDEPEQVIEDWSRNGIYRLLKSIYHHVWVYGTPQVFPIADLYRLPKEVKSRVEFLGYLGREANITPECKKMSEGFSNSSLPHLLCMVGGGGDGDVLAQIFLRMLAKRPGSWNGTLLTGPFLARDKRNELVSQYGTFPHIQILRFTTHVERLIAGSDAIITMGGYNAVMEAVSWHKRTLVVPRVFPRREQWLRAQSFHRLGLVTALDPELLDAEELAQQVEMALEKPLPPTPAELGIPWQGAQNFAERVAALLGQRPWARKGQSNARQQRIRA